MTTILTSTAGQTDLPRYFAQVFDRVKTIPRGRVDVVLPDGRRFRIEGRAPGFVAEIEVHNPDLFARLIREGDLGFSEAYLDGWWSTPDLQAFMDLVHDEADAVYDGFPESGWFGPGKSCGSGGRAIRSGRRRRTSPTTMIWAMISMGCGWTRR